MAMTSIFTPLLLGAFLLAVALGHGVSEEFDNNLQQVGKWASHVDERDSAQSPYGRSPYYSERNEDYDERYPQYEGNYDYNYDDGLGAGAIAGIVVGSVVVVAGIGTGLAFGLKRRRKRRKNQDIEDGGDDDQYQSNRPDLCSLSDLCGCSQTNNEGYYDDDGNFVEDIEDKV
ncbi:hypothetical protein NDN08_002049 [Rhodosorus marinus]|uniref:Uncharacterized protein n=1 Tax=Rhodosorus marinus TaxID=101924 RepID=A0AAV8UWX7_9RHOD|nr:hypothetical protein NDN08_002049 [Rhodosorus marinus]